MKTRNLVDSKKTKGEKNIYKEEKVVRKGFI
jgi:hypothetical protein